MGFNGEVKFLILFIVPNSFKQNQKGSDRQWLHKQKDRDQWGCFPHKPALQSIHGIAPLFTPTNPK